MRAGKKKIVGNIVFILILALIVFTPIRTYLQIWTNQLFSFAPKIENNKEVLTDFNWEFVNSNGELSNLREAKGKVIFINYWATWCPPCIAEMPSLQKLYNEYKNQIVFIFVTNDDPKRVSKFLDENNYNLPVFYSQSKEPEQLATDRIPKTFLIDSKGIILINKEGVADWNSESFKKELKRLVN